MVKGPASAQTGRGSTGGYINLFSKQPRLATFVNGTVGVGLPGYLRGTADVNLSGKEIGLGSGTALRINAMVHDADTPGRDHVEIAVRHRTIDRGWPRYLDPRDPVLFPSEQDNVPDYGIPFIPNTNANPALAGHLDKPAPVDYDNYYGLLERDYDETTVNIATFALEHDLTDDIRIANTTRYGYAVRNSIFSSPRLQDPARTQVTPQTQSRDTIDKTLLNQSNVFARFETGSIRHDAIAGFEDVLGQEPQPVAERLGQGPQQTCSIRIPSGPGSVPSPISRRGGARQDRHRRRLPIRHGPSQ